MNMMALLIGHSHLETWVQAQVLMQVAFNHTCMLSACKAAFSMSVDHVCYMGFHTCVVLSEVVAAMALAQ